VVLSDDLQFACIFPLPTPRQCTDDNADSCDCAAEFAPYERPLCEYPADPKAHGVQRFAKAYPGLRELGVLQGVKENGIVASICAKHAQPAPGLTEAADASYGYNPAVSAMGNIIIARLARQCLPRPLSVETDPSSPSRGEVPCAVVEALPGRGATCNCDESHGRSALGASDAKLSATVIDELWSEGQCGGQSGLDCHDYCFCKIAPLAGASRDACQNGNEDASTFGYCYIDPAQGIGNPALVATCPAANQRSLRFVGDGLPANGSTTFVACIGSTFDENPEPAVTSAH
jgi:hypothetical protein